MIVSNVAVNKLNQRECDLKQHTERITQMVATQNVLLPP